MFRPGHRFGPYRIESVLGEGGMGIVYEATDLERDTRIAIKVVNPDLALDPDGNGGIEAARRLVREGRAAASLRHPNAIAVLDAGEIEGTPYIAMELARGRSLGQFIGDKRVPSDQRIEWLCAMARGLAAAHTKGIVHRDVKPENVMVCDDGWVKLFDFGVAKPFADPRAPMDATVVTHTGIVVGTPLYMAPEQVLGEKLDPRSDQYAWATVAYELLSGGTHPVATTQEAHLPVPFAILKGTPKHLREVAPSVPGQVADVVMRALSKDPKARYGHMDRIVEALEAYLSGKLDPDATAPRDGVLETPWPHSEPTVALAPAPAPAKRPVVVIDDDEMRETVTRHFQRKPAPAAAVAPDASEEEPTVAGRSPLAPASASPSPQVPAAAPSGGSLPPAPESRRRAGGVAVSRPLRSAPRSAIENRADPAVLGPARPAARLDTPLGVGTGPLESPLALPPVTQAATGPVSMRNLPAAARKNDWNRRLLWIPILFVAALAGYVTYVLLAVR